MKENDIENPILSNSSMEIFDKCTKSMLIGFLLVKKKPLSIVSKF